LRAYPKSPIQEVILTSGTRDMTSTEIHWFHDLSTT
jgi:hypothetical protein